MGRSYSTSESVFSTDLITDFQLEPGLIHTEMNWVWIKTFVIWGISKSARPSESSCASWGLKYERIDPGDGSTISLRALGFGVVSTWVMV